LLKFVFDIVSIFFLLQRIIIKKKNMNILTSILSQYGNFDDDGMLKKIF